jgi:hypothetical protein
LSAFSIPAVNINPTPISGSLAVKRMIGPDKGFCIRRSGWLLKYRLPFPNRVDGVARNFKAEMRANTTRKSKTAACGALPFWHPASKDTACGHMVHSCKRHHIDSKKYKYTFGLG